MYTTIQKAKKNPAKGEINHEPSMTIEGEHQEMKDILNYALKGSDLPQTDTQYFRPEEIQNINSLYRASLDLTDIDALRHKTTQMNSEIEKAYKRKLEKQKELQKAQQENEQKTKPKKEE